MQTLDALAERIDALLEADRARLLRRAEKLQRRVSRGQPVDRGTAKLECAVAEAETRLARRWRPASDPGIPKDLPIAEAAERISRLLAENQVLIVAGATGSGKTTQLPKLCLAAGRGQRGRIGCTQPRRIAARSVAARVADELGLSLGQGVGYQVRFDKRSSETTTIKFMTDGILLAEFAQDPNLLEYDTIIIDEAHERTLNIDFLLGLMQGLLARRPELKLIVTSATIDTERFAAFFDAPVIDIEGTGYPVEVRYRPLGDLDAWPLQPSQDEPIDLNDGVIAAITELSQADPRGDILVFLPTERSIRECADALGKARLRHTEILPLFGRLPKNRQQAIFSPGPQRRIVLATNVAETSLTVPRIRFVIDSGLARISRFSPRSKIQRLPIEAISRASADQRKGRCGRTSEGICIRLYSEEDFASRAEYTDPEILRTDLASVILRMEVFGLGKIEAFPFLDSPDLVQIRGGYDLLRELQALDSDGKVTQLGKRLLRWPLDVRFARMIEAAVDRRCVRSLAIITAGLTIQDPRERPPEAATQADEAQERFHVPGSDFMTLLAIFQRYAEQSSRKARDSWCRENFLAPQRMREWQDLVSQILEVAQSLELAPGEAGAKLADVHRAILPGLLSQCGVRQEDKSYIGARHRKFWLFPGSVLFAKAPTWVMSAQLVETSKVYARSNGKIEPEWIEKAARHLTRSRIFDAEWSARRGRVVGFEQITLYGMVLVGKRRVDVSKRDPELARSVLLRALAEDRIDSSAEFRRHNAQIRGQLHDMEARLRRTDIGKDAETLATWFGERLPTDVTTKKALERFAAEDPEALAFGLDDLLQVELPEDLDEQFPDSITVGDKTFALRYKLAPDAPDDGVAVQVPLAQLGLLDPDAFCWQVPGLRPDHVEALLRSLPKRLRRHFVPTAEATEAFVAQADDSKKLFAQLELFAQRTLGREMEANAFSPERVPEHLQPGFALIDGDGVEIAFGKDLAALQERFADHARKAFEERHANDFRFDGCKRWDFGTLPERVELARGVFAFPALVDQEQAVGTRIFPSAEEARLFHRAGLVRLLRLGNRQHFRFVERGDFVTDPMCLQYASVDDCETLRSDLASAAALAIIDASDPVRDADSFGRLSERVRSELAGEAHRQTELLGETLARFHTIRRRLDDDLFALFPNAVDDVSHQLEHLIYPGFLLEVGSGPLEHYPRYLEAVQKRLDKIEHDPARDSARRERVEPFFRRYLEAYADEGPSPELEALHWQIEELRVSVYAQELGTPVKISPKRLEKAWPL